MKKITLLLTISLMLSSCKITQEELWGSESYEETFKSFFIDEKSNRVVLIGENNKAFKGRENYHYVLDDDVEDVVKTFMTDSKYQFVAPDLNCPTEFNNIKIKNIFEIGVRAGKLKIFLDYPQAKGSKILVRSMGIEFDRKNLSNDEVKYLHKLWFKETKNGDKIYQNCPIYLYRYPSSKETSENYKKISLDFETDKTIWERNTPLKTTSKILLTPFAVAADIVLAPVYLLTAITIGIFNHHANHTSDTKK